VVKAIVLDGAQVESAAAGASVDVLLDRTSFYAESGGQAGDTGVIEAGGVESRVLDTQKQAGDLYVHRVELAGPLKVGDQVVASVDAAKRTTTRANHSAAHLVHAALHHVLGPHVAQKGQMVDGDRMRFDFSHGGPLTADEIERIEAEVNAVIRQNVPAETKADGPAGGHRGRRRGPVRREVRRQRPRADPRQVADRRGQALFGRAVRRHPRGPHRRHRPVQDRLRAGVAAGVRRIEALTGEAARRFLLDQAGVAKALADQFKTPVAGSLAPASRPWSPSASRWRSNWPRPRSSWPWAAVAARPRVPRTSTARP
jgi:alanyl-tRNA synthetase